jgi:hypothetical protein
VRGETKSPDANLWRRPVTRSPPSGQGDYATPANPPQGRANPGLATEKPWEAHPWPSNAESGKFKEAVKWEKKAIELGFDDKEEAENAQQRLKLYEEGKPYRGDEV